jgi:DNA-binding IclR family transcriptional regulator
MTGHLEQDILDALTRRPRLKAHQIAAELKRPANEIRRALMEMEDRGVVHEVEGP